MPKFQYADQAVQGVNIYRQAKLQGNQEMMQQGLQMIGQATNALRGITDVQQARQQMQYARERHPFTMRTLETAATTGEVELAQRQREIARKEEVLAQVKDMIRADPMLIEELATVAEARQRGTQAEYGRAVTLERGRQAVPAALARREREEAVAGAEEAITGVARTRAERPHVTAVAEAAGREAEFRKLSTEVDLRNLDAAEITRRAKLESDAAKAKVEKEAAINDLDYIISDKERAIRLVEEQISALKKRGDLYEAQMVDLARKQMGDDMATYKEIRALMGDIQTAYNAITRLDAGEDVMDMLAKIGTTSGIKFDMQGATGTAENRKQMRGLLVAHIEVLESLINRHGYEYDITSTPAVIRKLGARAALPAEGYTLEERAGDLEGRYAEGERRARERVETQRQAPPGAEEGDIDTILDAFGL